MEMITGLIVAIVVLGIALALAIITLKKVQEEKRQAQMENLQLHQTNNRLSWETELLQTEMKCISVEYGIKILPWKVPGRRKSHA